MEGVSIERAREAKSLVLQRLSDVPQLGGVGLVRVGQGFGVKVNLSEPLGNNQLIPEEFDGVPILVEIVGRIVAR